MTKKSDEVKKADERLRLRLEELRAAQPGPPKRRGDESAIPAVASVILFILRSITGR